jgi:hypothetical protein
MAWWNPLDDLKKLGSTIQSDASWWNNNVVQPGVDAFQHDVVQPVENFGENAVNTVEHVPQTINRHVVQPTENAVSNAANNAWNSVSQPVANFGESAWQKAQDEAFTPIANFGSDVGHYLTQTAPHDLANAGQTTKDIAQSFENNVAAPVENWATQSAVGRGLEDVGLGALRSGVDTVQGLSGLYDMAKQGTLTPQQTAWDKNLTNLAGNIDQTVQHEHLNPYLYHGTQAATDLLQFATGGGEAKAAAKALEAAPKVGKYAARTGKLLNSGEKLADKATEGLRAGNFGQRVAGRAAKNILSPKYQAANAAFTGLQTGKGASEGKQVTPAGIAENLAIGGVGFPAAGATTAEIGKYGLRGARYLTQLAKDVGVPRPTNLTDEELTSARKFHDQQRGLLPALGSLTSADTRNLNTAARKLGQTPGTPQASHALQNALLAHNAHDVKVLQHAQALREAADKAKQFAQDHPIGLSMKDVSKDPNYNVPPERLKTRTTIQQNLAKALREGSDRPVSFGKLQPKKVLRANEILANRGEKLINDNAIIHPNVIDKLIREHVKTDRMSPEQLADFAYSAIHNKGSKVVPSKYPQNVAFVKPAAHKDLPFAAVGEHGGNASIKSAYLRNAKRIQNDIKKNQPKTDSHSATGGGGNNPPSLAEKPGSTPVSALRSTSNIVAKNTPKVKDSSTPSVAPNDLAKLKQEALKYGADLNFANRAPLKKDGYRSGFYQPSTGKITVYTKDRAGKPRQLADIADTLHHELGHHIDKLRRKYYGISPILGSEPEISYALPNYHEYYAIRKELPYKGSKSEQQVEILADAYRYYRTNPKRMREVAPTLYKEIDDFVKNPDNFKPKPGLPPHLAKYVDKAPDHTTKKAVDIQKALDKPGVTPKQRATLNKALAAEKAKPSKMNADSYAKTFGVSKGQARKDLAKVNRKSESSRSTGRMGRKASFEAPQKTGSTELSRQSQSSKQQLPLKSARNIATKSNRDAGESGRSKPNPQKKLAQNKGVPSSKQYKEDTQFVKKHVTPAGDFKQGRLDVQADVNPLDVLKLQVNSALKKLKHTSKTDYQNIPHIVEGTEKAQTEAGREAARRIRRYNDVVHAVKTNLKGSEENPPHYFQNYYRHEYDLSDPEKVNELKQLQQKALERDVKSGDFKYAGINDRPRAFKTLKEAEQHGFQRAEKNPLKEFNNYANHTKNRARAMSVEKHAKEADANSTGKTVGLDIRGGAEPIGLSKEARKGFRSYEAPRDTTKTGRLFDKTQNGIRGSLFSLGQFHQVNIGLLRAAPALVARGHGLSAAKGVVKMFAAAPVRKIGDDVIERAIQDGTAQKAARIGMSYGQHYANEGSGLFSGMFDRQMTVMQDTVARNLIKDLEKRGISLDSKEARKLGAAGDNIMGHINWEMANVTPGVRKAMNRAVLASQFTPSKFSLMSKALHERGLAGSYARRAVAANVGASLALTFAAGYLLHQKSDNMTDELIRSVFDPAIPTPWKDEKGNTLKIRLPGTDTSDIARLLGITLSRNKDGHLNIHWNPSEAPSSIETFMRNRLSPALSAGVKIKTNTTFANQPLYDPHASFGTKFGQGAASIIGDVLPIGLQGLPQLNAVNKHLPKSIREVERAHRPGNNPLIKSLASSFGFTPESDKTVGKRLHTSRYFNAVDEARDSLSTKKAKDAFDLNVHSKKNPVTGKYQEKPSVNDSRAKATALLSSPKAFNAYYDMNQKLAKQGEKVDPLWKQSKDKVKAYLQYQAMPPAGADKSHWHNKNKWYTKVSKQRNAFFNSLPPGNPDKPKSPYQYPEPTPAVQKAMDTYYTLKNSTAKGNFLDNHPEVIKQWDKVAEYNNEIRAAQGYAPFKKYPEPTNEVQNFMDKYNPLNKAQRKVMRNANPSLYRKMIGYYDKLDMYNINKQGALNRLKGEPLYTSKQAKDIKSIGEDFYIGTDGKYHLIPAGWMLGLGGSGYGSGSGLSPRQKLQSNLLKAKLSRPVPSFVDLQLPALHLAKFGSGKKNFLPEIAAQFQANPKVIRQSKITG